jgi:hypothetical protein
MLTGYQSSRAIYVEGISLFVKDNLVLLHEPQEGVCGQRTQKVDVLERRKPLE